MPDPRSSLFCIVRSSFSKGWFAVWGGEGRDGEGWGGEGRGGDEGGWQRLKDG